MQRPEITDVLDLVNTICPTVIAIALDRKVIHTLNISEKKSLRKTKETLTSMKPYEAYVTLLSTSCMIKSTS